MAVTNKELYEEMNALRKELESDDKAIEIKLIDLERKIDKTYTKLVQFQPVQKIVYGMVAIILIGFLSALLILVGWNAK